MDFAVQALFLVLGFSVALLVGGVVRWSRTSGVPKGLSVEDGAVRLDSVGKGGGSLAGAGIARQLPEPREDEGRRAEDTKLRPQPPRKARRRGK